MRGKDISDSINFKARAGRGVCSAVSSVSDLAERGIADNQKKNALNNQEIRIVVQGFIEMGRNVAPETLEVHPKERQTPHSQLCFLAMPICVADCDSFFITLMTKTKTMALATVPAMGLRCTGDSRYDDVHLKVSIGSEIGLLHDL